MFNQLYRENMRLLSQVSLRTLLSHLIEDNKEGKQIMADIETDEARLETDVQAETTLITSVQATVKSNADEIATLKAQVAALPPAVDTTAFETALTTLEANNTSLAAVVPAAS